MDSSEVKTKVEEAVKQFIIDHGYLIQHNVNERSMTHHLANSIEALFPGYDVECEYNRMLNANGGKPIPKKVGGGNIIPDIIIHKRGTNEKNLLVIEVKKADENTDDDIQKIKDCKSTLEYKYGLSLILGPSPKYTWL